MDTTKAEQIILNVANTVDMNRYKQYVDHIRPRTVSDLFRICLFAYASVHTTWELNVRLYRILADYEQWIDDEDLLLERIVTSRAGLHNNRTRYIMDFARFFWDHPDWFWKTDYETWVQYRDRIKHRSLGLGPAKSSFVVEMAYLDTAEVICTDTHLMQAYGLLPKDVGRVADKEERAMEEHWVDYCKLLGMAPAVTRWAKWDILMGYSDPRYWTHVLERTNYHNILGGIDGRSIQLTDAQK